MAYPALPKDVPGIPVPCVYIPGQGFFAIQGVSLAGPDALGNQYAQLQMTELNSASLLAVQGATGDVAVTGDVAGTLSAKFRGLSKMVSDVWDNVNHRLHVNVDNGNVNGQTTSTASAPVVLASDQLPVATKPQPVWAAQLGQSYTATTGVITTGGAGSSGLCIFNNSTTKTGIIYSVTAFDQTATQQILLAKVTADPILNTTLAQNNDNFTGAASAFAGHCTYSSTVFTLPARTQFKSIQAPTNQDTREVLTNGQVIVLPAGAATGLLVYMTVGATNNIGFNVQWIEL